MIPIGTRIPKLLSTLPLSYGPLQLIVHYAFNSYSSIVDQAILLPIRVHASPALYATLARGDIICLFLNRLTPREYFRQRSPTNPIALFHVRAKYGFSVKVRHQAQPNVPSQHILDTGQYQIVQRFASGLKAGVHRLEFDGQGLCEQRRYRFGQIAVHAFGNVKILHVDEDYHAMALTRFGIEYRAMAHVEQYS